MDPDDPETAELLRLLDALTPWYGHQSFYGDPPKCITCGDPLPCTVQQARVLLGRNFILG